MISCVIRRRRSWILSTARRAFTAAAQMPAPKYLTGDADGISKFVDSFDTFLFDCDGTKNMSNAASFARGVYTNVRADVKQTIGVLWSGDHLFDRVPETLDMLRQKGKRLVFVTNNSTKSRTSYKKKLDSMKIQCSVGEIFGSSYSAAIYISRILAPAPPKNKVYVLGESGIEEELASENVPFTGGTDPSLRREMEDADFAAIADGSALDPAVGVVLTGLDFHVNYLKLSLGYAYLQRGAEFLATNSDSSLPNARWLFPGAGSVGAPLARAIGREPMDLGKPSQAMMDAIEGKFRLDRSRTCMVGDRLNTDIAFGIEGKLGGTLCVLTGVSAKEEFLREGAEVVPMAYVDEIGDLLG